MHELSIAIDIVDIATREAAKENATKINKVDIEVGTLSGVVIEALETAMTEAIRDTMLEGSHISIHEIPAMARCKVCRHEFKIDDWLSLCPECGSPENEVIQGRELRLKTLEVT